MNTICIRVDKEDIHKIDNECIELFLKEHPEMKGYKISRIFMIKKIIEFYLK